MNRQTVPSRQAYGRCQSATTSLETGEALEKDLAGFQPVVLDGYDMDSVGVNFERCVLKAYVEGCPPGCVNHAHTLSDGLMVL
jgi:hypothetical protein